MPTAQFSIASNTDDGYRYREKTSYPVMPTPGTVGGADNATTVYATREFSTPSYYISVALLRWDTSSLPDDCTVTGVDLKIYVKAVGTADALSLIGEWATVSATQSDADWADVADAGSPVALSSTLISGLTTASQNTLALTNVSNVNLTGYTGLRLGITRRAADAAPTGYNAVEIASAEDANTEPQLWVTYTEAVTALPPTIRTVATPLRW